MCGHLRAAWGAWAGRVITHRGASIAAASRHAAARRRGGRRRSAARRRRRPRMDAALGRRSSRRASAAPAARWPPLVGGKQAAAAHAVALARGGGVRRGHFRRRPAAARSRRSSEVRQPAPARRGARGGAAAVPMGRPPARPPASSAWLRLRGGSAATARAASGLTGAATTRAAPAVARRGRRPITRGCWSTGARARRPVSSGKEGGGVFDEARRSVRARCPPAFFGRREPHRGGRGGVAAVMGEGGGCATGRGRREGRLRGRRDAGRAGAPEAPWRRTACIASGHGREANCWRLCVFVGRRQREAWLPSAAAGWPHPTTGERSHKREAAQPPWARECVSLRARHGDGCIGAAW